MVAGITMILSILPIIGQLYALFLSFITIFLDNREHIKGSYSDNEEDDGKSCANLSSTQSLGVREPVKAWPSETKIKETLETNREFFLLEFGVFKNLICEKYKS